MRVVSITEARPSDWRGSGEIPDRLWCCTVEVYSCERPEGHQFTYAHLLYGLWPGCGVTLGDTVPDSLPALVTPDAAFIPPRILTPDKDAPPPLEHLGGGLTYAPGSDLPFGKQFRMGYAIYTIYDRVVEEGYQAGIRAHQDLMRRVNAGTPGMLDDAQFALVLSSFTPKGLSDYNAGQWRAHFIAGWAAVFLGLIREGEEVERD